MAPELYTLIAFLVITIAYIIHRVLVGGRDYRKFFGKMVVKCPETHETVAVKVASGRAALASIVGREHVQLSNCTRWPEKADCDQACLNELKADPASHKTWTIASKWYVGKNCFYCGRPISELSHLDHSPAVVGPDGKIIEWDTVPAEKLQETLASARPVCWNCNVVESFWKEHPDLVVERPWQH